LLIFNFGIRTAHTSCIALISITQGFILQGLEAVLDKAVELEDGKKVAGFVKLVLINIYSVACHFQ
jgi:uncharacterized membrane protein